MTNEKLIKSAHIWGVMLLLLVAIIVGARPTTIDAQDSTQNSNQSNGNSNSNQSTRNNNSRMMKNDNANSMGGQTTKGNMSSADHKFMMEAARGGMMEVELGRMAAQQGSSDAIKQFGQRMVDDHSKANSELMTLAQSKGIMLPMELDPKHRADADKMMKMSGAEFDRAYAKMMLSDHNKDVAAFERQSMRGMDADLKAFATKTLPTLREHLQMAKALNGTSGSAGSNSNSSRP
jgi:putative membrane protein